MWFSGSTQPEPRGRRGLLLALALLATLGGSGCDVGFVDPNPPELVALTRTQRLTLQDEPVVYMVVLDLHLPDGAECTRVRDRLLTTVQQSFSPPGRSAFALTTQDVSPGCQQESGRRLDVERYAAELAMAESYFADRAVRPILVYFNNVDLPMDMSLLSDLAGLRDEAIARGAPEPLYWGMGFPSTLSALTFDETFAWTFSADPGLTDGLVTAAEKQLPLVTNVAFGAALPLLEPHELQWAIAFKGCRVTERVVGVNAALTGEAVVVDPSAPPTYRIEGLTFVPLQRSRAKEEEVTFKLEVCRANCDRLYALPEGLQSWSKLPFCFLGENR